MAKTIEYNWIENKLIENANKIRELAMKTKDNAFHGHVLSVDMKEKLTLWTKVNHVSKSGMTRFISLYIVLDNQPIEIVHLPQYEKTHSEKYIDGKGWKISGCGMDMGFELVYTIASFYGRSERVEINGKMDYLDMGYSINQRWL